MKLKKINKGLLKHLPRYAKTDKLTPKLKRLLIEVIWSVSARKQYQNLCDNIMIICESEAYVAACKHSIHFNIKSGGRPLAYVNQIVRSSYAGTIKKHAVELGLKTTRTTVTFK